MVPQIFRREGEYWTVEFEGVVCRLKHTRGMQHLAALLARPGERVAAVELAGAIQGEGSESARARLPDAIHHTERARVNVTRHLSRVIRRIAAHHPALGRHLDSTIRTGTLCSYMPDARLSVRWEQ